MDLRSEDFEHGSPIPKIHSQEGDNISPSLHWSGVPAEAAELALIVDDPDAPREDPFVHWLLYKIPAGAQRLPQAIPTEPEPGTPSGSRQGTNTKGRVGYIGPNPPEGHGTHHYHFKLYALDTALDAPAGEDKQGLLAAMEGHVLEQAELIGTYER